MASRDERRALKEWLTAILPEGMSREDVADDLGVTRKTISNMLNPSQSGFGNGLTLLRYLRLAGAVVDAPQESPAGSRLARLEDEVAESNALTKEALQLLREARQPTAEAPQAPEPVTGTDG